MSVLCVFLSLKVLSTHQSNYLRFRSLCLSAIPHACLVFVIQKNMIKLYQIVIYPNACSAMIISKWACFR